MALLLVTQTAKGTSPLLLVVRYRRLCPLWPISVRETAIHRRPRDGAEDGPEAGDDVVAQDEADEEGEGGAVGAGAAVPEGDDLAEPADQELAPEQVHLEAEAERE